MAKKKIHLRWPGIEPGSTAWKAAMLTTIPPSLQKGGITAADSVIHTREGGTRWREEKIFNFQPRVLQTLVIQLFTVLPVIIYQIVIKYY